MKIGHQEPSTCTPSLFLESWRMWSFLTHLVMFSDGKDYPREASQKSLAGVLEDMEGPDAPGDGLRWK